MCKCVRVTCSNLGWNSHSPTKITQNTQSKWIGSDRLPISYFALYDYRSNYENVLVNGIFASNNNKNRWTKNFSISTDQFSVSISPCNLFTFLFSCAVLLHRTKRETNKQTNEQTTTIKCNLTELHDLMMHFFPIHDKWQNMTLRSNTFLSCASVCMRHTFAATRWHTSHTLAVCRIVNIRREKNVYLLFGLFLNFVHR